MARYEDLLEQLKELGQDDLADQFDQFSATNLRKKASERDEALTRAETAERELNTLKTLPRREEALKRAGIDLDQLRPAERELIRGRQFEGDEPSEQEIETLVKEYQLPVHKVDQQGQQQTAAGAIAGQAMAAPAGGTNVGTQVVNKATTADWTTETWVRFVKEHPEASEALRRGEEFQLTKPFSA